MFFVATLSLHVGAKLKEFLSCRSSAIYNNEKLHKNIQTATFGLAKLIKCFFDGLFCC